MDGLMAAVERYLAMLEHERRASPHTLKAYRRDLQRMIQYCRHCGISRWQDLNEGTVRMYISERRQAGLSARSLQRELSALRGLFDYLLKTREIDDNLVRRVRPPKSPRSLPETLNVDELNALLNVTPTSPGEVRDRAMWELLYSSGLRLSELVALDMTDLSLDKALVRVRAGKGGKGRVLPVGRCAREAIAAWLEVRQTLAAPQETALFVNQRGVRISGRGVQLRLTQWGRRLGFGRPLHPHLMRHSFASHLLEASGDLRAVQELLGHADIATTQVYTHLDFQYLAKVYDQAHPRARRRGSTKCDKI